jgi:hypothetical protein
MAKTVSVLRVARFSALAEQQLGAMAVISAQLETRSNFQQHGVLPVEEEL